MMPKSRRLTALFLPLIVVACGGGGHIETVPGPVYLVEVENPMTHPMDIWYDDGVEAVELGRVNAGSIREFVVAGPADIQVEIIARDDGRTHTLSQTVFLTRPTPLRVVLSP